MKDFDLLFKKVQELCSKCITLKRENDRLIKEEAALKSRLASVEEQERVAKKVVQQNEMLIKQRGEVDSRLKTLINRIENAGQ